MVRFIRARRESGGAASRGPTAPTTHAPIHLFSTLGRITKLKIKTTFDDGCWCIVSWRCKGYFELLQRDEGVHACSWWRTLALMRVSEGAVARQRTIYDRSIIKSYEAVMVPITTSEPPTIAYLRRSWGDLWSQNHPSMSQKGVRVTASVGARRRTAPYT